MPSSTDQLLDKEIERLIEQYGTVPPGWYVYPEIHPYSIGWRMGGGEWHAWTFWRWWDEEKKTMDEAKRIEYFRRFPPPPRWLSHMIQLLWDIEPDESRDEQLDPYFKKAEELGFGTKEQYENDINKTSEHASPSP